MNLKPNILIFSVFQNSVSKKQNEINHNEVLKAVQDKGLTAMELQGRYNGSNELSILVSGFEHRALVEHTCKAFNQESYLESHNDRATFLIYKDGRRESIGTLTNVSQSEEEASNAFSYNPISGQYFICK